MPSLKMVPDVAVAVCFFLASVTTCDSAFAVEVQAPPKRQVVVYSFHGQFRCPTCLKLEEYARDTLKEHFADELKTGRIVFEAIDISLPENKHFVTDYQLTLWSIALSLREDGKEIRHKNLADIQKLVKDRQAFIRYLFGEVDAFLVSS